MSSATASGSASASTPGTPVAGNGGTPVLRSRTGTWTASDTVRHQRSIAGAHHEVAQHLNEDGERSGRTPKPTLTAAHQEQHGDGAPAVRNQPTLTAAHQEQQPGTDPALIVRKQVTIAGAHHESREREDCEEVRHQPSLAGAHHEHAADTASARNGKPWLGIAAGAHEQHEDYVHSDPDPQDAAGATGLDDDAEEEGAGEGGKDSTGGATEGGREPSSALGRFFTKWLLCR